LDIWNYEVLISKTTQQSLQYANAHYLNTVSFIMLTCDVYLLEDLIYYSIFLLSTKKVFFSTLFIPKVIDY